jgi:hypothetical protein
VVRLPDASTRNVHPFLSEDNRVVRPNERCAALWEFLGIAQIRQGNPRSRAEVTRDLARPKKGPERRVAISLIEQVVSDNAFCEPIIRIGYENGTLGCHLSGVRV